VDTRSTILRPVTVPRTLNGQTAYLERTLELLGPKLELVEEELRSNFRSNIRTIGEVGEHILGGGGKRMRPALLLLVAKMLKYEGRSDVSYGAVVEFIHTATLIHDDIIDEADVRRGRASVNYGWGNDLTVLVGDYVFMHSMSQALKEGNLEILRLLSDATLEMIEGEILGTEQNGRVDLTVDDYFDVVRRKTAALFGVTCQIPGVLVDLPQSGKDALADYGNNLGICFQLVDDVLDFTSSTEVLGKPALSDLKEGKVTLPLILALPKATARERELITQVATNRSFDGADPAEILAVVQRHGSVERTREIAREYAEKARAALSIFPDSPAKETLDYALDFVLDREK